MTTPLLFSWRYIQRVLSTRDPHFETAMACAKSEYAQFARTCPQCGQAPADLTWLVVDTASETWERGEGQTGTLTFCPTCKVQIDFFPDEDLTKIETDLRAAGQSSQDLPWSEADTPDI